MLEVTELAVEHLAEMLDGVDSAEHDALRLVDQGDHTLTVTLDEGHPGDQVVSHHQRPVLFIESALSEALDGATLDTMDGPDGSKLTIIPPLGRDGVGPTS